MKLQCRHIHHRFDISVLQRQQRTSDQGLHYRQAFARSSELAWQTKFPTPASLLLLELRADSGTRPLNLKPVVLAMKSCLQLYHKIGALLYNDITGLFAKTR